MTRYLIVGAGVSGMAAAEAIRRADPRGEITLVSDDPFGFYSRPGLAYYLSGEVTEPALFPPALPTFQKLSARLITARAAALDPDGHRLRLEDGRELPYDRLLLATGSLAVPLPVPGGESIPALKLDNLSDARRDPHPGDRAAGGAGRCPRRRAVQPRRAERHGRNAARGGRFARRAGR